MGRGGGGTLLDLFKALKSGPRRVEGASKFSPGPSGGPPSIVLIFIGEEVLFFNFYLRLGVLLNPPFFPFLLFYLVEIHKTTRSRATVPMPRDTRPDQKRSFKFRAVSRSPPPG